jgi:thymidylate synthase (FAD)
MENDKINVLDHGFVRLVDHMGSDVSVVRAARVSYDAAWRAGDDTQGDAKLINYLWKNYHTTPFEAVTFTFEVKAPIFVFRQWHRHRTQSINELSARYKELPEEFYIPNPELIGKQSKSSKQARDVNNTDKNNLSLRKCETELLRNQNELAFELYRDLLESGWPRELARTVLPLSTYSHMFVTMNLLNLLKFLTLRTHEHAQYEIRVYADAMLELIKPVVPVCVQAWQNNRK